MITRTFALVAMLFATTSSTIAATDTSKYLGDSRRTGYVDAALPADPVLTWTYHEKHTPRHAWQEPNREIQFIDFDYATQVAIGHSTVFFGSSADHKVYAIDLATGSEKWTFYTEGPVRFAPVVYRDRVFVASDDGYLYCLGAKNGSLIWKFRGGPSDNKLIGNDQMISRWPARSGVLIDNDKLFFSAGMWSRDGVFIYCLDPEDGSVEWKNDTSGFHFATLPHHAGFAGVAPQGYLLLHRNRLYVPTGRGAPACFDAQTGEFIFYENGHGYKPHQPGGSRVMAYRDWIIFKRRSQHSEESVRYEERQPAPGAASGIYALDFRTGDPVWSLTDRNVFIARKDFLVLAGPESIIKVDIADILKGYEKYSKNTKMIAYDDNIPPTGVEYAKSGKGHLVPHPPWMSPLPFKQWEAKLGRIFMMVQAGETILAGAEGYVAAVDFNSGKVLWKRQIDGDVRGICVTDDHFIVSSAKGKLYCFGKTALRQPPTITHKITKPPAGNNAKTLAGAILKTSGISAGYALMLGVGNGQLLCELIRQSDLTIYCLEPDENKARRIRKTLDDAALLGVRAAVHAGSLDSLPYNPYFANLIVFGDDLASGASKINAKQIYSTLRPSGGVACQLSNSPSRTTTRKLFTSAGIPDSEISVAPTGLVITRGKLPGAGQWTHAHADIGRTGASTEKLARLPLAMLWWGGPGPARTVSRHWRSPVPLFSNGNLYIQGQHDIIAVDAYNGHEMWNRHIEDIGRFPPSKRGGNIVADDNSVYCIDETTCLRLDAKTGETIQQYKFIIDREHQSRIRELLANYEKTPDNSRIVWEYLGISGNYIIGSLANEAIDSSGTIPAIVTGLPQQARYVFAFDKTTGKLLWDYMAERAVSPIAMVADKSNLYILDRTDERLYQQTKRRGQEHCQSVMKSIDLATGKVLWQRPGIAASNKSLLLKNNTLVTYPNPSEVREKARPGGVAVYDADGGKLLWEKEVLPGVNDDRRGGNLRHTFAIGDTLYLPWAYDLRTGEERLIKTDPLTGEPGKFDLPGKNFCGTVSASEHLVMYRSASIGFAEPDKDSGAFWLPEVRPSCWISVIAAGGIVLAPEGYSTCICPYNYKTSLALMPVDRNEDWSIYLSQPAKKASVTKKLPKKAATIPHVTQLRLNLNAPGDHLDSRGNVWLTHPRPTGNSKRYAETILPLSLTGQASAFRFNSDYHKIAGTQNPWLYTSGIEGPIAFDINLSDNVKHTYTVRLHFAEPESLKQPRVFDIKIQGKTELAGMDILRQTKKPNIALVKQFTDIPAKGKMTIELKPIKGKPPIISAMEIIQQ